MASLASGREWGINAVMMNAGRRIDFLFTAWRRTLGIPRRRRVSLFFCFERNDNNNKNGSGQGLAKGPSPNRVQSERAISVPQLRRSGTNQKGRPAS